MANPDAKNMRRKEDLLEQKKSEASFLKSIFFKQEITEKEDGTYAVEESFSFKKTLFSSIIGLLASSLLTWGVWVTNSVYSHNTTEEVVKEQVETMQKAVGFEINERKTAISKIKLDAANDVKVLHQRITRLDTELTDRMNGLDTKIESARLSISEKVSETKDSLGEKMDRQTDLMMQLLQLKASESK